MALLLLRRSINHPRYRLDGSSRAGRIGASHFFHIGQHLVWAAFKASEPLGPRQSQPTRGADLLGEGCIVVTMRLFAVLVGESPLRRPVLRQPGANFAPECVCLGTQVPFGKGSRLFPQVSRSQLLA